MPTLKTTLTAAAQTPYLSIFNMPFIQTVWNVKVKPGARSVRLSFNTMHDCVPAIELYVDRPTMSFALMELITADRIIWPFLSGLNSYHFVEFDDLPENTTFWFRITAYVDEKLTPNMLPAYQLGMFTTGRRSVDIVVDTLEIWRDGDELSDGDIYFSFEALNLETGLTIDRKRLPSRGYGDFSDGSVETLNWHLATQNAPDLIAILTYALEDDTSIFNPGLAAIAEGPRSAPYFPPQTQEREHIRRQVSDMATTRDIFRVPDKVGNQILGFVIDSGEWDVLWYKFFGKLLVNVTASAKAPVVFTVNDSKPRAFKFGGFQGIVAGAGKFATIPGQDKSPELRIGIADSGRVFWYAHNKESSEENATQKMNSLDGVMAGPLTVLPNPEGGHDLFATDKEGVAHRAHLDADGKAMGAWRTLGGRCIGKLTGLRLDDGRTALFATDLEGAVSYRLLQKNLDRGGGKWVSLGGRYHNLAAHPAGKGRIHLIALDEAGSAAYQQISYDREVARNPRWQPLGGKGLVGVGFFDTEEGELAAFAIDAKRHLFGKLWRDRRWQPGEDGWMPLGDIDRLAFPDPFATHRASRQGSNGVAKSNGKARTAKTKTPAGKTAVRSRRAAKSNGTSIAR